MCGPSRGAMMSQRNSADALAERERERSRPYGPGSKENKRRGEEDREIAL